MNNVLLTALVPAAISSEIADKKKTHSEQIVIDGAALSSRVVYVPQLEHIVATTDIADLVRALVELVDSCEEFNIAQRFVHLQNVDAMWFELLLRNLKAARFRIVVGTSKSTFKEL